MIGMPSSQISSADCRINSNEFIDHICDVRLSPRCEAHAS
jgi:hypothetical protein